MIERLLIVRLGSLGDLIHTLPAAAALRRACPAARIDWIVEAPHRDLLAHVPVLSSVIVLRDRSAAAWMDARRRLRAARYDVAADFQGLVKSALLARLSGARRVVGFERTALRESLAARFYTERVPADDGAHVVRKNLALAAALGATMPALQFPIEPGDVPAVSAFLAADPRPHALINPGAAWPNKRWPLERFGRVARAVRDRHGLTPVVLWGPGEEAVARDVVSASGGAARLAPPTDLSGLLALARGARLIVSGDTGPLHVAAALGVPAVALFGPTNPERNGPWDAADITVSRYAACACHYQRRCGRPGDWCLARIAEEDVLAAIEARLG